MSKPINVSFRVDHHIVDNGDPINIVHAFRTQDLSSRSLERSVPCASLTITDKGIMEFETRQSPFDLSAMVPAHAGLLSPDVVSRLLQAVRTI